MDGEELESVFVRTRDGLVGFRFCELRGPSLVECIPCHSLDADPPQAPEKILRCRLRWLSERNSRCHVMKLMTSRTVKFLFSFSQDFSI